MMINRENPITHLNDKGEVRMVYVGEKQPTARQATAQATVRMSFETLRLIRSEEVIKGDVLASARIAGIMAAKRTSDLIPLCHPLPIDGVDLAIELFDPDRVVITATVHAFWRTGVEMEALTAVSVAALTIYDMCKSVDRAMVISEIMLMEKSGGRSGLFRRPTSTGQPRLIGRRPEIRPDVRLEGRWDMRPDDSPDDREDDRLEGREDDSPGGRRDIRPDQDSPGDQLD